MTGIVGTVHSPRVYQWNFQIQRELAHSTALIVNYVGNHSENIPYTNAWPNAFDEYGLYTVKSIPENVPVPNYGTVTSIQSGGISNYDGLQVSVRQAVQPRLLGALQLHVVACARRRLERRLVHLRRFIARPNQPGESPGA